VGTPVCGVLVGRAIPPSPAVIVPLEAGHRSVSFPQSILIMIAVLAVVGVVSLRQNALLGRYKSSNRLRLAGIALTRCNWITS